MPPRRSAGLRRLEYDWQFLDRPAAEHADAFRRAAAAPSDFFIRKPIAASKPDHVEVVLRQLAQSNVESRLKFGVHHALASLLAIEISIAGYSSSHTITQSRS
jgi:hypothetical protein